MANIYDESERINPRYAQVAIGFLNFPFPRDVRQHYHEHRGNSCTKIDLPGEPRVQFQFPVDAKPRLVTDNDMKLLFELEVRAAYHDTLKLKFPSFAQMLTTMHYGTSTHDRKLVMSGLELWSEMSVLFREWYFPRKSKKNGGRTTALLLPPPLKRVDIKPHGRVCIEFDEFWYRHWSAHWKRVPLDDLPSGSALNVCLKLLGAPRDQRSRDLADNFVLIRRKATKFARECGLTHNNWRERLHRANEVARQYFEVNEGEMRWDYDQDGRCYDYRIYNEVEAWSL